MARSAEEFPRKPAVVVTNPDEDVTADTFRAWLDQVQDREPIDLPVSAAEALAEARTAGEV